MKIRFGKGLVDAALVGAQRPAALKGQCDALEGRAPSALGKRETGAWRLHRSADGVAIRESNMNAAFRWVMICDL